MRGYSVEVRGSLRELGPGRWELRIPLGADPVSGKRQQRSVTFRGNRDDAHHKLAHLVEAADAERVVANRATIGQLLERWRELKANHISPTTAREYRRLIDRRLRPDLGDRPITLMRPDDLDAYYLRLQHEGLSASSVRQIHAIVRGALSQAVKWRWLTTNPARDATPPKPVRRQISPPTATQVHALLDAATRHSPELGMLVRLGALLGARRGELCGLRWTDIDLPARQVTIRTAIVDIAGVLTEKDTKTARPRTVSIDDATTKLLRDHQRKTLRRARTARTALVGDAFVLSESLDGSKPYRPDKATAAFRTLAHQVGLDQCRLHDLRHFVATQMIATGHDIRTVAGRLGHTHPSTTLNTYAAFLPAPDRQAADNLGALLDQPR